MHSALLSTVVGSKSEQQLRVAVRDAGLCRLANGNLLKELAGLGHRLIWIVSREHDPIEAAEFEQQVEEDRRKIHAGEREMHVLPEIIDNWTFQFRRLHGYDVEALKEER